VSIIKLMLYFEIIPVEILRIILALCLEEKDPYFLEEIQEFRFALYSIEFWKLAFNYLGYRSHMEMGLFNKDLIRILQGDTFVTKIYSKRSPQDLFRIFSHECNNIYSSVNFAKEIMLHRNLYIYIPLEIFSDYSILMDNIDIDATLFESIYNSQMESPFELVEDYIEREIPITGRIISEVTGRGYYEEVNIHQLYLSKMNNNFEVRLSSTYPITFKDKDNSFYNILLYLLYNKFRGIKIRYNDN
jgi:hypothetical protein